MLQYISVEGIKKSIDKMQYPRETFRVNVGNGEVMEFTAFMGIQSRVHEGKIVPLILDIIDTNIEGNIEILERRMKTIRHPKVRNAFLYNGFIYTCVVDKILTGDLIELSQSFRLNKLDTVITRLGQKYLFPFIVGDSDAIAMHMCVGESVQRYNRKKLPVYNIRVNKKLGCIR